MPNMRGTEATKNIRELGYCGVIIGITGNALPEDVREFMDHGADGVVPKPFDMEVFKKRLQDCLRSRAQNGYFLNHR